MLTKTRRQFALGLAAGATVYAALAPRQGSAAETGLPKGLSRLVKSEPRALPEAGFTDAEGRALDAGAYTGKGLLINFWATWCAPCVAEMPALQRTQQALGEEGLTVLALSSDRGGRAQVEAFYQRLGITALPVLLDPRSAAARAFGARGLPTSVIVNRQGREVGRLEGEAEWDHPLWLEELRRLALA